MMFFGALEISKVERWSKIKHNSQIRSYRKETSTMREDLNVDVLDLKLAIPNLKVGGLGCEVNVDDKRL